MLNEIREGLRGRIPPESELDFETVVDLVAQRRDHAFPDARYDNELGVAWMSCCSWPGMPERNKSAGYRAGLQELAQNIEGIAFDIAWEYTTATNRS